MNTHEYALAMSRKALGAIDEAVCSLEAGKAVVPAATAELAAEIQSLADRLAALARQP